MSASKSLSVRRPASATAATAGTLTGALAALGAPSWTIIAGGVATTWGPLVVSVLVDNGGVRGVARMLWAGRIG